MISLYQRIFCKKQLMLCLFVFFVGYFYLLYKRKIPSEIYNPDRIKILFFVDFGYFNSIKNDLFFLIISYQYVIK
jgi:hypothetical protein